MQRVGSNTSADGCSNNKCRAPLNRAAADTVPPPLCNWSVVVKMLTATRAVLLLGCLTASVGDEICKFNAECETWSVTGGRDIRMLGLNRDEVRGDGENYMLRSFIICTPYQTFIVVNETKYSAFPMLLR